MLLVSSFCSSGILIDVLVVVAWVFEVSCDKLVFVSSSSAASSSLLIFISNAVVAAAISIDLTLSSSSSLYDSVQSGSSSYLVKEDRVKLASSSSPKTWIENIRPYIVDNYKTIYIPLA